MSATHSLEELWSFSSCERVLSEHPFYWVDISERWIIAGKSFIEWCEYFQLSRKKRFVYNSSPNEIKTKVLGFWRFPWEIRKNPNPVFILRRQALGPVLHNPSVRIKRLFSGLLSDKHEVLRVNEGAVRSKWAKKERGNWFFEGKPTERFSERSEQKKNRENSWRP